MLMSTWRKYWNCSFPSSGSMREQCFSGRMLLVLIVRLFANCQFQVRETHLLFWTNDAQKKSHL